MATRRSRIKNIANIPLRKKTVVEESPNAKPELTSKEVETPTSCEAKIDEKPSQEVKESPVKLSPNLNTAVKSRRSFIKPLINTKLFSKFGRIDKAVSKASETTSVEEIQPTTDNSKVLNSENDAFIKPLVSAPFLSSKSKGEAPPLENSSTTATVENEVLETNKNAYSDNESLTEPLSPVKAINRSRIKPVPRLGQRRTSMTVYGSASESEDEPKKNYKRIRTESTCSTTSVSNDSQIKSEQSLFAQKNKEYSSIIQRKCKRTEQSRKMAEARRHFNHKFSNRIPDKHNLTMMDLLFYNPTSNPMSQKPKKESTLKEEDEKSAPASPNEETHKIEPEKESEEENDVPAPQIKIGPNGEIVIDEKSLVIENKETKKGRELLERSELINGDFDTGYGIYKREKRTKDWSKDETVLFYKALNTLGTDFTLMVQLFPGRNRRELKMKFKKEERMNRLLIDKALMKPVEFNITELKEETEERKRKAEEEEREKTKRFEEWTEDRKKRKIPYSYIGVRNKPKIKMKNLNSSKSKIKERIVVPPNLIYKEIEKGISSVWDLDSSPSEYNSSSDEETLTNFLKPTRSGRVPKPVKFLGTDDSTMALPGSSKCRDASENDLQNLIPGSLMIVCSETPEGQQSFNVFMVTPSRNKVPISLTEEVIEQLKESVKNKETDEITENNYTIIHDNEHNISLPNVNNEEVGTEGTKDCGSNIEDSILEKANDKT